MDYVDPLMSRGQLAIVENRLLRSELKHLRAEHARARELLQVPIVESVSVRAEARSVREEMIYRRAEPRVVIPSALV